MLRTQISILAVILAAVFIEIVLVPSVWSGLRVDLFMGMIIGIIIHMGFSQGISLVLFTSLILQAFSGARPGLIPMIYFCVFFIVVLLKGIVYMENVFTQLILGGVFYVITVFALVASMDVTPGNTELIGFAAGAVLTGLLSPLMVALVGSLKKAL